MAVYIQAMWAVLPRFPFIKKQRACRWRNGSVRFGRGVRYRSSRGWQWGELGRTEVAEGLVVFLLCQLRDGFALDDDITDR